MRQIKLLLLFFPLSLVGQNTSVLETISNGSIHGNFQLDGQYYRNDSIIGTQDVPEDFLTNGFANIIYSNKNFAAGVRYESYLNPLLGFPTGYKGNGIAYRYASFNNEKMGVTVGNFYEQFGNGLILRTYEERGLGYDNAFDGIRVRYEITKGLTLKGLVANQKNYFEKGEGVARGLDGEISLNQLFNKLEEKPLQLTLGASFVSKYQQDKNSQFNLPENVGAWASRLQAHYKKIAINTEYAYKINDPSADNFYNFKSGHTFLLETSYSKKGLGISLAAKRVDNMSFRSEREATLQELQLNYLPALTRQHTYNLLATLYPYATQPNGEIGFQGEITYKIKRKTLLGGKYGTSILLNYASVYNIDSTLLHDETTNRQIYQSDIFKIGGKKYYEEVNVEVSHKFSKKIKGIFTYSNLVFNQDVIQGKPGYPMVYANVGVIDVTYKLAKKHAIRTEVQGLFTQQDNGDWATMLIEYTFSPNWFLAVMDQYNYGNKKSAEQIHYYFGSFGYTKNNHRIQIGYGRQRAGIFCVGGVCRNVPAANGLSISITSNF